MDMEKSGIANRIREEDGNERYEYFLPLADSETVWFIDRWRDQDALDAHHASPMIKELAQLREKYDLHMRVERATCRTTVFRSAIHAFCAHNALKMRKEKDAGFVRLARS
jgi:quinol monooxygenase YgiN